MILSFEDTVRPIPRYMVIQAYGDQVTAVQKRRINDSEF